MSLKREVQTSVFKICRAQSVQRCIESRAKENRMNAACAKKQMTLTS
jgi:hypothetical protein